MNYLSIVIPLGVSSPGTPVVKYLKWCLESLNKQNTKYEYKIIVACDTNVSDEVKDILTEQKVNVSWYEPYYFMRKGGIWKKIHTEWNNNQSKYIAFCHYDDVWDLEKIQTQIDFMENKNLELSWSSVYAINSDNKIVSRDLSIFEKLDKNSIRSGSYAFTHSSILKRDAFLSCGISDKVDKASSIYEHLQFVYSHKLLGFKNTDSKFFHRVHEDSVSNQFNTEKDFMIEQRKIANYSLQEVLKDGDDLNIENIIKEIESSL